MSANRTASFFAKLLPVSSEPDADLLRRFVSSRDATAFEILVRRHGSLVFAICRRIVGHTHDAEDAFQAVFLVLAQNAGKIREPHLLQSWLYGVAVRVAKKAKRRKREQPEANLPEVSEMPPDEQSDLWPILDEELAALSDLHRQAILLCDVQELSRTDAAAKLGIPEGTLSSRLAKGRKLLAQRLARRGVVLSLPALASVANATVPETAIQHTLETVNLWAGGGLVGTSISELAREGMTMMRKLFLLGGGVLSATMLAVGLAGDPKPDEKPKEKPEAKPAAVAAEAPKVETKFGPPKQRGIVEVEGLYNRIHWSHDGTRILLTGGVNQSIGRFGGTQTYTKICSFREGSLQAPAKRQFSMMVGMVAGLHPTEPTCVILHHLETGAINVRNQLRVEDVSVPEQGSSSPKVLSQAALNDNTLVAAKLTRDGKALWMQSHDEAAKTTELREVSYTTGQVNRVVFRTTNELWWFSSDGQTAITPTTTTEKRKVNKNGLEREEEVALITKLNVWDCPTNQLRFAFDVTKHGSTLWTASISHDGKAVAVAVPNHLIVLDLMTGRERIRIPVNPEARSLDAIVSHDGGLTLISEDKHFQGPPMIPATRIVTIYDNTSGKAIKKWETDQEVNFAFAPNSPMLAVLETEPKTKSVAGGMEIARGGGAGMPGAGPGMMGGGISTGRLGIWDFGK